MAIKPKQWLADWFSRYKYVLLVGLIGVGLLLLPSGKENQVQQLQGAGQVKLLLTTAQGERYIYQTDSNAGQNGELRLETVIVSGADRQENPVLQQTVGPVYQGAVVLCQGAADAAVRLAVVEAVSKATGLGADKICVLKMK